MPSFVIPWGAPVPVPRAPVWGEPVVRLLAADARRLSDQLECDDTCQMTVVTQWASTRTPLVRWAANRSALFVQRQWDDAVYRHWVQVRALRKRYADVVYWMRMQEGALSDDGDGSSSDEPDGSSGRFRFRQIGDGFLRVGKRSVSLLRGCWPRRQPKPAPADTVPLRSVTAVDAIRPLHAEIKSVVAVTLRHGSPLVVLGFGLQLLAYLLVGQAVAWSLAPTSLTQRMLPRLLDNAAIVFESSRRAEARRLAAAPPAAAEAPAITVAHRQSDDAHAAAAQWSAIQLISSD